MESDKSWEQEALINELIQGMEIARKLKEDLMLPSSIDTRDSLLERLLSSYDKALLILRLNEPISESQTMNQAIQTSPPQSPVFEGSPLREDAEGATKDRQQLIHNAKKRKMVPKCTEQVRVKIENSVQGPLDDGYNWRKYGQKDILSAKYPRSYYRCTFRKTKGCCATKQVQRSEEDPNIFDITYRGSHTCKGNDVVMPQKSGDREEKAHGYYSNVELEHAQSSQESLITKYTNTLTVKMDNITAHPFSSFGCIKQDTHNLIPSLVLENNPFLTTHSQTSLLSPNTPQSNYFVSPSFLVHEFDGVCNQPCPDSDAAAIVSTATSTTNSPIFDFNFSLDAVGFDDSNFPFNSSGFLS